jgi:pilus assembly protein TadC
MMLSALLLAAAALIAPGSVAAHRRVIVGTRRAGHPVAGDQVKPDPLAVASSLDVLAVCLAAGMAVPAAAAATAPTAPRELSTVLRRAAEMLALGADPTVAWSAGDATVDHHCDALLRLARRSASSGAALADGVAELAASVRSDAADAARATAERASVLIAGPLGLCYLPAFVCLGIVPVVAGLAGKVLGSGLL